MFDIGFSELILLGVVALIVLGPEKLPHAARMAGAWYGRIKRTIATVQQEIAQEVDALEIRQQMEAELKKVREAELQLHEEMNRLRASVESLSVGSIQPVKPARGHYYFLLRGEELSLRRPPAPFLGQLAVPHLIDTSGIFLPELAQFPELLPEPLPALLPELPPVERQLVESTVSVPEPTPSLADVPSKTVPASPPIAMPSAGNTP